MLTVAGRTDAGVHARGQVAHADVDGEAWRLFPGRSDRSPEEVRDIVKAARADLWSAIEAGKLSLPIDKTFPLAQAAEALAHMKANAHFGKIVLVV